MRVACKKFQSEKKKSTINNKFSVAFISVVLNCSLQSQWQYKDFEVSATAILNASAAFYKNC
jgi:hypothetical protein